MTVLAASAPRIAAALGGVTPRTRRKTVDVLEAFKARYAFVFPGQGSQYVGMGKQLYETSPAARQVFEEADAVLGFPLSQLCFEGPQEELDDTINAQPAILTVSIACLEALRERYYLMGLGPVLAPMLVAGHSLGEYTALVAADVLKFSDALKLVRERGRLMKATGDERPGGMAAVIGLDEATLEDVCRQAQDAGIVTLANANSPGQTVLSGEIAALQRAMELARERGARLVQRLAVSIASHSPLMSQVARGLYDLLGQIPLHPPRIPLVANISGQVLTSVDDLRLELSQQVVFPVQWTRSVQSMMAAGVETFVELGPNKVLSGLIRRISGNVQAISLSDSELVKLLVGGDQGRTSES
jgi:[acyl-carrier-protein] S-malonyltransferase